MAAIAIGITLTMTVAAASSSIAQTAREVVGPTPLLALKDEPPPRLIVDPPLPEPLALGRVFIQYRAPNMRILPMFGAGALQASPRIGHVHVTVDNAPWHFVDASGGMLILVGLPPGPHSVLIELADPTHGVVASERKQFVIPLGADGDNHSHPAPATEPE